MSKTINKQQIAEFRLWLEKNLGEKYATLLDRFIIHDRPNAYHIELEPEYRMANLAYVLTDPEAKNMLELTDDHIAMQILVANWPKCMSGKGAWSYWNVADPSDSN